MPSIIETWRDHKRYTDDGLPDAPANAPLPYGDPRSGPHNPTFQQIRDTLLPLESVGAQALTYLNEVIDLRDTFAGLASDAVSQGFVPLYAHNGSVEALEIPGLLTNLRTSGRAVEGDGGGGLYIRVPAEPTHAGKIRSTDRYLPNGSEDAAHGGWWELAQLDVNVRMFGGDLAAMLGYPAESYDVSAGEYAIAAPIEIPAGAIVRMHCDAVISPAFEPVGSARAVPIITVKAGAKVDRLKVALGAGVDTIRTLTKLEGGVRLGRYIATSVALNNNRTEPGATDRVSGALLLQGDDIEVGPITISRFDKGVHLEACDGVTVGRLDIAETVTGFQAANSRNFTHTGGGTITGADPAESGAFVNPRGIMTPGGNAVVLAGLTNGTFTGLRISGTLEHGIRVGARTNAAGQYNRRITFVDTEISRTYGCGFKCDDGDAFEIELIRVDGLHCEDIGRDHSLSGNKEALSIRNTRGCYVTGYSSRPRVGTYSGYRGLWIEKSVDVTVNGPQIQGAATEGICIQGGMTMSQIAVIAARVRNSGTIGCYLRPLGSSEVWRGITVEGDFTNSGTYDLQVDARAGDGGSPFATTPSRVTALLRGGAVGTKSIQSAVAADPDFLDKSFTS